MEQVQSRSSGLSAFAVAAFGGPFLGALLGSMFVVPVLALWVGLPVYLLFGLPAFALCLRLGLTDIFDFLAAGAVSFLAFLIVLFVNPDIIEFIDLMGLSNEIYSTLERKHIALFGAVAAPFWGLGFGVIYCIRAKGHIGRPATLQDIEKLIPGRLHEARTRVDQ